jgi:hypothetical protein
MKEMFTRNIKLGGSTQKVTFFQPGMNQMIEINSEQPDWMEELETPVPEEDLTEDQISEMISYARLVVDSTTNIDSATVNRLGQSALANLTGYCKLAIRGETPTDSDDGAEFEEDPFEGVDMDYEGKVELEEMR